MRRKFLAVQGHCPPEKTFAIRESPFAFFSDLPICPSHDLPKTWLGKSLALPFSRPSSRVPRPIPFLSPVPCPMSHQ
jgi:hypothetical protein